MEQSMKKLLKYNLSKCGPLLRNMMNNKHSSLEDLDLDPP
jgi:hypothetical protein